MSLVNLPDLPLSIVLASVDITTLELLKEVDSRLRYIIHRYELDKRAAKTLTITRSHKRKLFGSPDVVWVLEAEIIDPKITNLHKKTRKIVISNNQNKVETAKIVQNVLKDMRITSVESLNFGSTSSHMDSKTFLQGSGLDLSYLQSCEQEESQNQLDLHLLDDNLLQKIISKQPRYLNFEQCQTSVTVMTILEIIKTNVKGIGSFCWHFGNVQMTEDDHTAVAQFAEEHPRILFELDSDKKEYSFLREHEFPTFHQHIEWSF